MAARLLAFGIVAVTACVPTARGRSDERLQTSERPPAAQEFRGHYLRGFEHSAFVPCPGPGVPPALEAIRADSAWLLPVAAWVPSWGNDRRNPTPYPAPLRRPSRPDEWFVIWRGRFIPTDSSRWMGISRFEFAIDSVLEARAPAQKDCAVIGRAAP